MNNKTTSHHKPYRVNKIHILWNKSQKNILFEINTVSLKFFDEYCIISPDKYIQYDVLYDAYCVYITKFISLDHIKAYQYMQNPRLYFHALQGQFLLHTFQAFSCKD